MKQILVACVGNIFNGDDAFGVEVSRRLGVGERANGVHVVDFGIRSFDLGFALEGEYHTVILVDAVSRGSSPGSVYLIEPDLSERPGDNEHAVDAHSLNPKRILQLADRLGNAGRQVFLVGCEPGVLDCPDGSFGLSEPVEKALPIAVEMIETLIKERLQQPQTTNPARRRHERKPRI